MGEPIDAAASSQTDWSMIYRATQGESEGSRQAWDSLARRYWPAIYAFARKSGHDVHVASDLTQGFVCEVMLGRGMVDAADPTRGRFRNLLLTAFRNYMTERHRHGTRRKRAPQSKQLELDRDDLAAVTISHDLSPEAAFAVQWSEALVQRVLEKVRLECVHDELCLHWAVFEARVVRPLLHGEEATPYSVLVNTLDLRDTAQAANMMITVKRRVARALYDEVSGTVSDPADTEDELHALLREQECRR